MTSQEYELLRSEELRLSVLENRERDPLEIALDKRLNHASLVATQVKYLRRAGRKLPSYAAAGCMLSPRAYEQASSEAAAAAKQLSGDRLLDLCCGLGVDSFVLSHRFREVVALERDPLLAELTKENFRRLGAKNIRVEVCSAEEYLSVCSERFDWIYADPDRRDAEGRRQFRLEACSPDITALGEPLRRVGSKLCFKLSPLFDVDEALRFAPGCRVEALSSGDECKELLIYDDGRLPGGRVAESLGQWRVETAADAYDPTPSPQRFTPDAYRWLLVPDVALKKVRIVCHTLRESCFIFSENGYGFAEERPDKIPGRIFEIERVEPYSPKTLRRELKGARAEILRHDFPASTAEILRQTGLREGGDVRLAFTRIGGKNWTVRLK